MGYNSSGIGVVWAQSQQSFIRVVPSTDVRSLQSKLREADLRPAEEVIDSFCSLRNFRKVRTRLIQSCEKFLPLCHVCEDS